MDVDGSAISGEIDQNFTGEIDQNLLLQFSCMNTNDREELIGQMQRLLGPSLNYKTASFFLDMSNWNLQTAICCYLDSLPPKLPSMSLKAAQTQETTVVPGTRFEQTWSIANTGTEPWPSCCRVIQAGGEPLGSIPVYLPPLPPGHSTTVTMKLVAPSSPGNHRGYFHMVTNEGDQIGYTLLVDITVESEMTIALAEQLAALPISSNRLDESKSQMPSSQDDQMC
ncbi:protein ILRUN [Epargyreus clarus]|uniref:protein ILRUN n=1 Tax=Epargyreus clarus TaxID=520877 RepID=UPI003C2B8F03